MLKGNEHQITIITKEPENIFYTMMKYEGSRLALSESSVF